MAMSCLAYKDFNSADYADLEFVTRTNGLLSLRNAQRRSELSIVDGGFDDSTIGKTALCLVSID